MLSDINSDQQDYPRCGHCGAPLADRFTRCAECHTRPVDSRDARPVLPPLTIPLDESQPMLDARLPARRIWRPSSRALAEPYDAVEEPATATSTHQRLRQPIVLSASVLVVTSAVYLGFIHSSDPGVGPPIEVSGKVKAQKLTPPVPTALAGRPASAAPARSAAVAAQPRSTIAAPQRAPVPVAQRPTAVVAQRAAPLRSPPIPPPNPSPPPSRRLASVTPPDARRGPGAQPGKPPDKLRADVSTHLRAARADLRENNLAATRTRLAAAIAAQPDNRDALTLRSTLSAREQQRDALLSLARGCGYIARWNCVWHNAGTALQIDASSKEAQRLVTLATRETELQIAQPVAPAPEPVPVRDIRELDNHH